MDDYGLLELGEIENGFYEFLADTAKQIHSLLQQDIVKKRFQQQIHAFVELSDKHWAAFQLYKAQAKAENKTVNAMDLPVDPLFWFTPPTKQKPLWYNIDNNGMTIRDDVIFPAVIREPNDNEILMCHYVKLAVIHGLLAAKLEIQAFFFSVNDLVDFMTFDNNINGYIAQAVWEKITSPQDQWNNANKIETRRIEVAIEAVKADLEQNSGKAGDKKTKRGRQKKYTPEILKAMQKLFDDVVEKQKDKDVKASWSKVADTFGIKSGKAAEMAVRRHQKQNK